MNIKEYLPKEIKKTNIKSERAYYISLFLEKLNQSRLGTKYKPLTARCIAVKVGHISTDDLAGFYYDCEKEKNFSKYFWWAIRAQ